MRVLLLITAERRGRQLPDGLPPGIYEDLVTDELHAQLDGARDAADVALLSNAEAPERVSRHVARVLARAISSLPDGGRAREAAALAGRLLEVIGEAGGTEAVQGERPVVPPEMLREIQRRDPSGALVRVERPLTPLLDTTVLTNSPGEPALVHELRTEIASAAAIDVVVAFVRFSGIRPLLDDLRNHCAQGKSLRVLTTTYTGTTEQRALEELTRIGAEVRVSYDTTTTRLHAKAWTFHRPGGYSTAYVGSSNLTHSAQVAGLEWNVRVAEALNPDVIAKVRAVFDAYWSSGDFTPYDRDEFELATSRERTNELLLSPVEVQLRPFQERMLEQLTIARAHDRHRNLLVSATGTGKTVMAAVDYARLRSTLKRDRLLFVAHREEILAKSRATFAHALRDASFGELWVGGRRPSRFVHVFASIQSLSASGIESLPPDHFDVVIVDEFHHAAAPSYEALLARVQPTELLGLTATPERADGMQILHWFDGRIAAELRLWDAIDQQQLAPFSYFGVHDGLDLSKIPWRRGVGYDVDALTNVLTADHVWARRVIEQVQRYVAEPTRMRAIGFCVSVAHARFMAQQFEAVGISARAVSATTARDERATALADLDSGTLNVVFAVDLFNEGVDLPNVDTLLLLRPTDSATLYIQQIGRGLRKAPGKSVCTILDFVAQHRREYRFDRRLRALLGGTRRDVEAQVEQDFPFLPAGCSLQLDPVARDIVLRSLRDAIPSTWQSQVRELRSLGDVGLRQFLLETGLDIGDVYRSGRSWTELRRTAGFDRSETTEAERKLLKAVERLLHVNDRERVDAYRRLAAQPVSDLDRMSEYDRRLLRMLLGAFAAHGRDAVAETANKLWSEPTVLADVAELLSCIEPDEDHLHGGVGLEKPNPLRLHGRYTRAEIFGAFDVEQSSRGWQTGVWFEERTRTDLLTITLDKSTGAFSPTTRYKDYAISPELIHWESQSATAVDSPTGQRYLHHRERGTNVMLFARLAANDRAFWCLGLADYVSHERSRPIAITWRLRNRLPADLYASFAAAVA